MTPRPWALYRRIAGESRRFRSALERAASVQAGRLREILARHAASEYGRRHGFATIGDYAAYRDRVPVATYADLAPWIDRMAAGERGVLVDAPVVAFEETGGTTRGPKLVPYTAAGLDAFRRALLAWLDDLAAGFPEIASGRAYWAISPVARPPRTTAGGTPIGLASDAAYFGDDLAPLVLETLAVPPSVGAIADVDAWREATVRHLRACDDLALVSVWSPTFFSGLLAHLGSPPEWPRLRVLSCWDQASARPYAAALGRALPRATVKGKGLLATEGVVSIPLADAAMPVLAVESGFFEFQDDRGRSFAAHEVAPGSEYAVLMTTDSGLYRYAIGDRVRVHGFAGEAPLLEFLGRGTGACDLCGEKLTEAFVVAALAPLGLAFALLAPAPEPRRGYALFVDADEVPAGAAAALAARADLQLAANPQYAYARRLDQLEPLAVERCVRPLEAWLRRGIERGQRLGDIKPPALDADREWHARLAGGVR